MRPAKTADFSIADRRFMSRALEIARRGLYTAHPNPRVGCVLVRDGRIVGEGWHEVAGGPHAEIVALAAAGEAARGATAYVTLEPCVHQGRTGPCTEALLGAGVAEVVSAMTDPNPKVGGGGHEALEAAGVTVRSGLLAAESATLNEGFLSRIGRGRPFVRVKMAVSLDGRTAMADGTSQWITGEAARADVHRLRAMSGAVMSGIGTVLADDPSLTARTADAGASMRQPLRAIMDGRLRMPPTARMLGEDGETAVFCIDDEARAPLESAGATVYAVPSIDGRPDPAAVLAKLAELGINDVLVEAGPVLAGGMLTASLIDELVIYQAPHIMGSETRGMFDTPGLTAMADRAGFRIMDRRAVGEDLRLTARPQEQ